MEQSSAGIIRQPGVLDVFKLDLLWLSVLIAIGSFLLIPAGHDLFVQVSTSHVYLMAFVKFAILATMGELLAVRILNGRWVCPVGLIWRAAIWGILGALIALIFYLYASGVSAALERGLIPSWGGEEGGMRYAFAFFTSALMNMFFAPTFMALHRITDTYIDQGNGKLLKMFQLRFSDVLNQIDWNSYIRIVVCKTIPLFWIPAHTITFLLPEEHRVLAAAFLSIALGAILALSTKKDSM